MSIEPGLLMILIGVPIIGCAVLSYLVHKKKEWRKPITWAVLGIVWFEAARQIFTLLYGWFFGKP